MKASPAIPAMAILGVWQAWNKLEFRGAMTMDRAEHKAIGSATSTHDIDELLVRVVSVEMGLIKLFIERVNVGLVAEYALQ